MNPEMTVYRVPLKEPFQGDLYAGPFPADAAQAALKENYKIQTIVNLTELEMPIPSYIKRTFDIIRFPIEDYGCPPSVEKVYELVMQIKQLLKTQNVYIHCQGGKGRTGTIVACFLITDQELTADAAIKKVRELSSGSIEAQEQEEFVRQYHLDFATF